MIKKLAIALIIAVFLALAGWLGTKAYLEHRAAAKAEKLIQKTKAQISEDELSQDRFVLEMTRLVLDRFEAGDPSSLWPLRIRGIVTNDRLPAFLRLESGVIETLVETGLCDNASRMLRFVLAREGYATRQLNMQSVKRGGHAVTLVTVQDGREVFADPFYGVVLQDNQGRLMEPDAGQEALRTGARFDGVFAVLGDKAKPGYYKDFQSIQMAPEGQEFEINASLPALDPGETLVIGEEDGRFEDVKGRLRKHDVLPVFYYLGHKYDRGWVRILKARSPVQIRMDLVSEVADNVMTATPPPDDVNGKTLIWDLEAGEKIIFRDSQARVSLTRLNSYLGVDRITLTGLQAP